MAEHGGNLTQLAKRANRPVEDILDFSANINPLGPPDWLRPLVSRSLEQVVNYPDPDSEQLVAAAVSAWPRPCRGRIVAGNGSTELLRATMRALPRPAIIPAPCYSDYVAACEVAPTSVRILPLSESEGFVLNWSQLSDQIKGNEVVLLGRPNNPTGMLSDREEVRRFASSHPQATFVIDEAFIDFCPGHSLLDGELPDNVIVLRSLTKFYAIPGLRLGLAIASAPLVEALRRQLPPWSVNSLAQAVGIAALADADYAARTVAFVNEQRAKLVDGLSGIAGLHVYPSQANYLLVRIDKSNADATALADKLLNRGIAIRTFAADPVLDKRFFRVAVRAEPENARLVTEIAAALNSTIRNPQSAIRNRRPMSIMLQGAGSSAGKSVLAAALCRIMLQDGYRVAPFKSQNMSNNSFVTRDGGEMGRAQVVQAQACRLEPDTRMNPILLKPSSDTGCQVIVRGQPVGHMKVRQYVAYKPTAWRSAVECFHSLAAEFDAVVIEGAGSPAEVNLKSHDIANMAVARLANAPVLIVGDIDRGGVFASFVGTMEVLADWERKLVGGWIVNRFRGDAGLLAPAFDYTLRHTGRPVLGVVPYLHSLDIPQEDAVEFKSGAPNRAPARRGSSRTRSNEETVTLAVLDLPHISNFTDLDAFAVEPDVTVRVVHRPDELGSPDAVIIPGSKNTLGDLSYLRKSGLASQLLALFANGRTEIIGICGGFQMLGRRISDPHQIESTAGPADGLGLLNADTTMSADKTLARTSGKHVATGLPVAGYEIHHGRTSADGLAVMLTDDAGRPGLGVASADGLVWGTYLHGVFDADGFRRWFVNRLRSRRNLPPLSDVHAFDVEPAIERLADAVRAAVDMKAVYRLMERFRG